MGLSMGCGGADVGEDADVSGDVGLCGGVEDGLGGGVEDGLGGGEAR